MSKFIFVTFPDEAKAYEGTQVLTRLHAEGALSLYGMAVVAKDAAGNLVVKQKSEHGPLGIAVGSIVGGVIGLLGGPIGVVVGAGSGAMLGFLSDLAGLGVSTEFLQKVSHEMLPGRVAVIAEVSEDWITPLDTRMSAIGGIVHRTSRTDVEDELARQQMASFHTEMAHLKSEFEHAKAEDKARLRARIGVLEIRINAAADRLQARLQQMKDETAAKLKALEVQVVTSEGKAKARVEARIAELRADADRRGALLKQAWGLTKKAAA